MSKKKSKVPGMKGENIIMAVIRIVLGLVFIFSSVMKGIDPLGTAYRVGDYLAAYSMDWLGDFSLFIAFFLIAVEFLLGIALLFKLQAKLAAIGTLLIMIFFTVVTYYDARYNLVTDCGCFGDAIKLDNWETFYKNIVLIVMALVVFLGRKHLKSSFSGPVQLLILIVITAGFIWFNFYNYNHLPMVDFRDWKKGRNMKTENEDAAKTLLIYKNKTTGDLAEYTSENLPWRDTAWMNAWEFVDQRYDDSEVLKKHHVILQNAKGTDFTKVIIENPGYQMLLVSYDIDMANGAAMLEASKLFDDTKGHEVGLCLVTASDAETLFKYFEVYNIFYPFFQADEIELKAMIRSNPGLVLLKDGMVINKWHYHDFPKSWQEARLDSVD